MMAMRCSVKQQRRHMHGAHRAQRCMMRDGRSVGVACACAREEEREGEQGEAGQLQLIVAGQLLRLSIEFELELANAWHHACTCTS